MRTLCFLRHQNRCVYCIRQKNALLPTENRTTADDQANCMISFVRHNFFPRRESEPRIMSGVSEPQHYREVNRIIFFCRFCKIFSTLHIKSKWTATLAKVNLMSFRCLFSYLLFFTHVDRASGPQGLSEWTTSNKLILRCFCFLFTKWIKWSVL
jgi:hypothetical protein